ncbi:MAG TPA: sulfate/molybdate ABC transporter ATP-binding protein [Trueperaceae bacterium]|nr:sulfate/molybdate ABC transporter ATP-binding protein [Trueperaceae bacterium]
MWSADEGAGRGGMDWGESVAVKLEDVSLAFDAAAALRGVSLEAEPGELMALLGPSGSGKTTLLRVVAGLLTPDTGRVWFGDEDASRLTVQQRNVGMVFQHYALFRHMTVYDNIAFGLRVRRRRGGTSLSRAEVDARVRALIELVQLGGLERRYPAQLSGGQRQRVGLARALAIKPRVLLLDEPFGALDAKVRRELRRGLRELHDRTGHTTLFVTHDQEEALELADRVAVMREGRVEQVGDPDEVLERPASRFVFEFIGESNLLPVEVRGGALEWEGRALALPRVDRGDGPALLAFRPHDVELAPGAEGAIEGVVVASRRVGANQRLELEAGRGRARLDVDVPHDAATRGRVAVLPRAWHLFDG